MSDFEDFDLIFGMDTGHVRHLKKMAPPDYHHKIHLYLEYAGAGVADVPDPYYGGFEGFEEIYKMIDKASNKLIWLYIKFYVNYKYEENFSKGFKSGGSKIVVINAVLRKTAE